MFTRNALDGLPPHVKFVSFDTTDFDWGSGSVRLLYDIRNGRMPAEPIIDSGVDVVTAENVDEYLEARKRMEAGV